MSDACDGLFHSEKEERNFYGENIYYCGGNDCYTADRAMNGEHGFCEFALKKHDMMMNQIHLLCRATLFSRRFVATEHERAVIISPSLRKRTLAVWRLVSLDIIFS